MIHYITTLGLGQPWVGNELHTLARHRVPFVLHAMRRPRERLFAAEWASALNDATRTLYPLPILQTMRSILLAPLVFRGCFVKALWNAIFGERESMRARFATLVHFFVACHWAWVLRREPVRHIHAQWAHSSASIGMYGAWLLEVPFSFTGHAADLFRNRAALRDKIRRAEFIVCISTFHRRFYLSEGARPDQLVLAYCGIDSSLFAPKVRSRRAASPFAIRSAGRLVEKKGFRYLIEACRQLRDRGERFECVIAGSGPLEVPLRKLIRESGLCDRVLVTGAALVQEEIPEFMHQGDVFCLPCVWASDNDVDGLPQLIMEAMACGVPVISTRLVGIPDLVRHEVSGILVEPNDAGTLADAIVRLIHDPATAARLRKVGRDWITERFDLDTCLAPLTRRFLLGASNRESEQAGDSSKNRVECVQVLSR